jgi:hypothetical protein
MMAPVPALSKTILSLIPGRCGIWVGELNGGTIWDNSIVGYDKYPELPLFGVSPQESTQLLQDFTHPSLFVTASR